MADSQTIDQLAIEITSSIKGEKKLQTFTSALKDLARTTSTINTGKLTSTATAMKQFSNSISGMKTGNVKNLVNSLSRLSAVNPNLSGINGMTSAISHLASVSDKAKDLTGLANALGRIAKADMSGFNTGAFNSLTSSISTLANSLSATNNIDSNLTRLVTAIAKLSGSGQYINNVSTYLPTLGNALVKLTKDIAGVGSIDANMSRLVDGIARLANAGAKAADSAKNLDALGDAVLRLLNKLKSAPAVNTNIANTINGLGNLAASGARFGNVSSGVASTGAVKFGNALKSLKDRLHHTNKSSKGLASTIGLLYAKFWLLKRAIQGIGNFVGYAQDYIEGFNYFNVAMQKIGEDSKDQFARFGYESADEYAKSFSGRFTKLQKQLSGFNVNPKTGTATFSGDKYLGIDLTAAQQYQAEIAQITNTTGQLGEVSIATSKAMSMLAADWSSLTNTDIVDVQENLRSGLIGMSRAVYKYGIDITNASLQQIAYNHNVSQSVAKMSNMSKQQLRIIGILEQSKIAYTDLARTINQPANQLRMLQAGFKNLARTIGQIFLPIVQKLYPYLNAIVMVLQEFVSWIAKLTGADLGGAVSAYKVPDIDYGDAADDTDAMADNTKKTAKNTKKIKDNIQSFDILNKLDKNDDTTSNPDKNTGDNGLANIDLSEDIQKLVKGYEKMWDKAFKSSKNKAVELAKKMKKALLSAWATGDFTKLGEKLGNWITRGISKVNTNKIKALLKKLAKSAATFLNGAITGLKTKKIGKNFAEFINGIIDGGYTFLKTFNWLKFGKKLGKGVMSFIKNFDSDKYGRMLGAGIRGMIQAAWGFVGEIDFSNLGKKISDGINGFLDEMGKVDKRTGLSGWQELGQTVSNGITGIADTLITALDTVNWDKVAKAMSDFIGSIKWFDILLKTGHVIVKALWSVIKTALKAFANDPLKVGEAVITILAGIFAFNKLKSLIGILKVGFGKVFSIGLKQGVASGVAGSGVGTASGGIFAKLGSAFTKAGSNIASNFMAGFNANKFGFSKFANAFGGGLKAALATELGALWVGVAATAAVAAGLAIGSIITNAIDEQIKAHEYAVAIGHEIGKRDVKNIDKAVEGIYKVIKGNYSLKTMSVDELSKAYQKLANKTNRSATETVLMKQYQKELSDRLGKTAEEIKKNKDNLDELISSEERRKNINKAEKNIAGQLQKESALKEKMDAAKKAIDEAEKKLSSYQETVKKTVDKYNNATLEFNWTTLKWENPYQDEYNRVMAQLGEYANAVNKSRLALNDLKKARKKTDSSIETSRNLIELGEISNKEYADSIKTVVGKMEKLGIKGNEQKRIVGNLKNAVDKGYLSWGDYKKIVNQNYNSQNDMRVAIGKTLVKTSKYKDLTDEFTEKMEKLNTPSEKQSEYINAITRSIENGTSSLSDYEKIVKNSAGDTESLNTAMDKIKNKDIKVDMEAEISTGNVEKKIEKLTKNPYNLDFIEKIDEKSHKSVKEQIESLTGKEWTIRFKEVIEQSKREHDSGGFWETHADLLNLRNALKNPNKVEYIAKTQTLKIPKEFYKSTATKAQKEVVEKAEALAAIGEILKIKKYKKGGILEDGIFTMNKGEIAGKFDNGRSAVANNETIQQAFAQSITNTLAPAIFSAVKQAINEANIGGDTPIYLDGVQITKNVQKHNAQMTRQRGKNPMLV